jgi:hypothetical protein
MKQNRSGGRSVFFTDRAKKIQLGEFGVDKLCVIENVLKDAETGQNGLRLAIPSSRVQRWYTTFEEEVILAAKKHPAMDMADIDLYRIQEELFHSDMDKQGGWNVRLSKKCQFQVYNPETQQPETVNANVLRPGLSILPMVQFQGLWINDEGFGIVARITDILIVDDKEESSFDDDSDDESEDASDDESESEDASDSDESEDGPIAAWHPESVVAESVVASMAPIAWD